MMMMMMMFLNISTTNQRLLWRHLPTELQYVQCVTMHISSSSRRRKPRPNPFIIGDAILPETGTKLTEKRGSKFGALLWRHLTPHRKNRNIDSQLQSILYTTAQKRFWKISFLYDFCCAQSCSFGLPIRNLTQLQSALCSDVRKKIYIGAHLQSRPKLLLQNFSKPSAVYTKWCAQTFPPIFWIFAIFDSNFAKIVTPPSNKNENYVACLKEQCLLKKKAANYVEIGQ